MLQVFLSVEYVVYSMWEISEVIECAETLNYDTFEIIVLNGDPAVFEIGVPYNIPTAIVLQVYEIFLISLIVGENYTDSAKILIK